MNSNTIGMRAGLAVASAASFVARKGDVAATHIQRGIEVMKPFGTMIVDKGHQLAQAAAPRMEVAKKLFTQLANNPNAPQAMKVAAVTIATMGVLYIMAHRHAAQSATQESVIKTPEEESAPKESKASGNEQTEELSEELQQIIEQETSELLNESVKPQQGSSEDAEKFKSIYQQSASQAAEIAKARIDKSVQSTKLAESVGLLEELSQNVEKFKTNMHQYAEKIKPTLKYVADIAAYRARVTKTYKESYGPIYQRSASQAAEIAKAKIDKRVQSAKLAESVALLEELSQNVETVRNERLEKSHLESVSKAYDHMNLPDLPSDESGKEEAPLVSIVPASNTPDGSSPNILRRAANKITALFQRIRAFFTRTPRTTSSETPSLEASRVVATPAQSSWDRLSLFFGGLFFRPMNLGSL